MAGHVVDSLVVELGLDPSKLNAQQQQTVNNFKRFTDSLQEAGGRTEDAIDRVGDAIGGIKTQALEMFALFTGSKSIIEFGSQVLQTASNLGRLERNIGVSAETISKWQGVARIFGGDAQSMASSFKTVSDAFAGWKVGQVSPMISDLRAIQAAGGKAIDMTKGVEQSFLDLADNLKAIHDRDPAQAGFLQSKLGLDPALFDALIQGSGKLKELLGQIAGVTSENARAASELDRQWQQFIDRIERATKAGVLSTIFAASRAIDELSHGELISRDSLVGSWLYGTKFRGFGPQGYKFQDPSAPTAVAPTPGVGAPLPSGGAFTSQTEKEAFIRQEAIRRGIDPDVAVRVAKSEGFSSPVGDNGTSFGAFQLHVTPGGRGRAVGDQFKAATGLDPSDPANERATIAFALDDARKNGWGAYHGARNTGIPDWAGINSTTTNTTTTTSAPVSIENLNVYPPPGTDGKKFANDISSVARRQSAAAQSNYGQQ